MTDSEVASPPARSGIRPVADAPASSKLAESIARQLENEIIDLGWPVGTVLGSEAGLIARLGISRAVFREAVRLLEHHLVATMRRGPGGGLVVTAPGTSAVTRAMALSLEYQRASVADLFEARATLELKCVELAAQRIDEQGIIRLREACRAEAVAQEGIHELGTHVVHRVIAELSQNPVFVIFLETLTKLTTNRSFRLPLDPEVRPQDVRHAHDKIAEAVISGDASLARHRMDAHLSAMRRWMEPTPVPDARG